MQKTFLFILSLSILSLFFLCAKNVSAALPSSTNYKIESYTFGAGGANNVTSTNFGVFGALGEVEFGRPSSTNFKASSGLTYILNASVSAAPTVTNPGNTYDRLQLVLNITSNPPTDTTYAIQVSTTSNFSSNIYYVKSDNTIGTTLAATDFRTYASFGGASGFFVTGLTRGTTYYFRVTSKQGKYTQTEWGPSASLATANPTLTFTLSSNTLTFSPLNGGNSYTDSSKTTTLTTSTNAYNGYIVYAKETQSLTTPGGATISDYASPNSSPTAWSGTGFGYTTSDANLVGGTANRFSGSKYAGFPIISSSAGDPVADDPGPVQSSQITNEQFTISYRITVNNTTAVGTYSNVILYTIVPSY